MLPSHKLAPSEGTQTPHFIQYVYLALITLSQTIILHQNSETFFTFSVSLSVTTIENTRRFFLLLSFFYTTLTERVSFHEESYQGEDVLNPWSTGKWTLEGDEK